MLTVIPFQVFHLISRCQSSAVGGQPGVPAVGPESEDGQDEHDAVEGEQDENRDVKVNLKRSEVTCT